MTNWLSQLLPFAGRTRPSDAFSTLFQRIAALIVAAAEELAAAFRGKPEEALGRIADLEHQADAAAREIHKLVDRTFITPYDKRDIVMLTHRLDDIVDTMRTATRLLVSYRALEARESAGLLDCAKSLCDLILRGAARLKLVVDQMPVFEHDKVREAARFINGLEDEADELHVRAIRMLFPDPNQPLTAASLAWREIFRLLERTTDYCDHAMTVIVTIARQEGN